MAMNSVTSTDPWWTKPLDQLDRGQWEALCDGCGRCCLHKIRDEDTERVHFTNVACRMLDTQGCGCRDYANRRDHVPDCVQLKAKMVPALDWLPPTCAYHLLACGQDFTSMAKRQPSGVSAMMSRRRPQGMGISARGAQRLRAQKRMAARQVVAVRSGMERSSGMGRIHAET